MRLALVLLAVATLVSAPVQAAPPAASPPPRDETDPQAKRITGSETYVPTFGLRASIARGFKVHGVLAVDAGLDVPDAKTVKKVEAMKPRIMAMMREAVLSYASLSYVVGERPDADMLRTRLQKAVDQVMGKDTVKVALASVIVFKDERS
jgi:hypothetical protein